MKFSKQMEEYEQPEWRGHYLNYQDLKLLLTDIKAARCPSTEQSPTFLTPLHHRRRRSSVFLDGIRARAVSGAENGKSPLDLESEWRNILTKEAMRVGDFVDRGLTGLEAQLRDLDRMSQTVPRNQHTVEKIGRPTSVSDSDNDLKGEVDPLSTANSEVSMVDSEDDLSETQAQEIFELRILEALGLVSEGGRRLRSFLDINHAALYKILKNHDKVFKVKSGLGSLFPKLVQDTGLGDTSRFDALDEEVRRLSRLSSQTEGLNACENVVRLAAGLGMGPGGVGSRSTTARNAEIVLSFFLGCAGALLLSIAVLLALPEADPESFSTAYFLTPMPVFRVVFSVLMSLWCVGAVARTCEKTDINHLFVLNIDPRCRVTPGWFFSRAAGLTTLWILIFGMYVVDYKWMVVPPILASEGFNTRSSAHFLFYPLVLLFLTVVGMLWHSRICRNRYKIASLRCVGRTIAAPFYAVDFSDNMVGDILTSLAKPLQDVPAAMCYLSSQHPQPIENVVLFVKNGNTCSDFTHNCILPIINGLPFYFRAWQCLRRYRDTGDVRHLWNLGKYMASLSVVVVSHGSGNFYAILTVSLIATVYAGAWDIFIDWGLGWRDLFEPLPRLSRAPSSLCKEDVTQRHFSQRFYLLCSIVDLFARSTWVLTLMPISVISQSIVGRVVLVSLISSVEILRRSMWAVLRIEHEQVANASGYRALLWVPSKLHSAKCRSDVEKPGVSEP